MTDFDSRTDPKEHDSIFPEILKKSGLDELVTHDKPKAIILAGQPGAGKGNLVDSAIVEHQGDILPVDPDELRDYHPEVKRLRGFHPYTWSGDTHPDASQWVNELRELAVQQKKNIIIDTTLGHGDSAVRLVNSFQDAGYEVEIRAVVAHRLESELGIDQRFTSSLDKKGYGHHVPAEYHGKVYEALPGNLDRVRAETTAPVRVFSREGLELYGSRTDTRMPGAVMAEERAARMQDPLITRTTHRRLDGQVRWHDELPNTIQRNPRVSPEAAQHLFVQRAEGHIAENIRQSASHVAEVDHATRVHPARMQGARALGAAGLAASAYDAADTHHRYSQWQAQDNPRAAQAEAPYRWSGRTHADASQWADELREARWTDASISSSIPHNHPELFRRSIPYSVSPEITSHPEQSTQDCRYAKIASASRSPAPARDAQGLPGAYPGATAKSQSCRGQAFPCNPFV